MREAGLPAGMKNKSGSCHHSPVNADVGGYLPSTHRTSYSSHSRRKHSTSIQWLAFDQVFSHTLFKLEIIPQLQNVKSIPSQIMVELELKPFDFKLPLSDLGSHHESSLSSAKHFEDRSRTKMRASHLFLRLYLS